MFRADRILSQEQRAMGGVPDGERPIPHELGEAVGAPFVVSRRDDGQVRGIDGYKITQITDEISAIIQAAVPSDDSARRRNTWLFLSIRLLGCVESAIENLYATVGIGLIAIGAIRSEGRTDVFDIAWVS